MMRITLVIPCYNEAKRLDVDAFTKFQLSNGSLQLLFVDDGSQDGTGAVLETIRASAVCAVDILTLPSNQGKSAAVREGFLRAIGHGADYVGFWDADLATSLEELPAFVELIGSWGGVDVVMGSRVKLLGRRIERRLWRHYIGRFFATAISATLGIGVYDTQCGAKLFRVNDACKSVFAEGFSVGWLFDVEILARYLEVYSKNQHRLEGKILELPLQQWLDVSGSKVSFFDGLRALWDLIGVYRRYIRPLKRKAGASRSK